MIYQNTPYGIFDQKTIQQYCQQEQVKRHNDQLVKVAKCAQKLEDLLKAMDEVEPQYKQLAFKECCVVAGMHMAQKGIWGAGGSVDNGCNRKYY